MTKHSHIDWEDSATIARRIFGATSILQLNDMHAFASAAIQHYRDSLEAKMVLPESVACVAKDGFTILYYIENKLPFETDLYTVDQVRQAISDALCVAEKETAELRLYKHNMEARFKGLNSMLADALAKQSSKPTCEKLQEARRIAKEYGEKDSQIDNGNLYFALMDCLEFIDALAKQDVRSPMFKFRECEDSQAAQPIIKDYLPVAQPLTKEQLREHTLDEVNEAIEIMKGQQ